MLLTTVSAAVLCPAMAQDLAEPAVAHALKVRKAVALGNYHTLAKLYKTAPNMGAYIIDHFLDQFRVKTLQTMVKG